MTAKLISIIGPPAVGKTTLAEYLSAELPAEMIREDYAGNPFLADSFVGPPETRLPGQLCFLMSRVKQLSLAGWPAEGLFVSDYGFCQDRVYAEAKLGGDDLRLYGRVARRVERLVRPPDVLVGLDAGEDVLLERIAARGRSFERVMTAEFLSGMRAAYNRILAGAACPVVTAESGAADLRDASMRAALAERIKAKL